jgi:O-antigen/teichoic acid export membrane protein
MDDQARMVAENHRNAAYNQDSFILKLGKDTVTYLPASLVPALVSILSVSLFTRLFSPSAYGQYALVVATVGIANSLLSAWVQQSTFRYRAYFVERGCKNDSNRNLIILLSIITVFIVLLSILVFPFLRASFGSYRRFYGIAVGLVVVGLWYSNLGAILKADLRSVRSSQFSVMQSVLRFGFALGWVYLIVKDITGLLWGTLLAQFILIVPMAYVAKLYPVTLRPAEVAIPFGKFLKKFAVYGFPMIGWFMGAQLLNIADRYLLQVFRGSVEVGIYAPNYSLVASAFGLVTAPLITAAHPLLMKVAGRIDADKRQVQTLITSFSRYFLLVALPVSVFVGVFSREVAVIFLGEEFRQGHVIIPIILFGFLAWNFSMYGHKGLEIRGRTRMMLGYVLICAVVNVLLNLYFVPRYGYMGAAVTTLVSFLLYPVLVYFGTRNDIAWHIPWKSMGKIGLASLLCAGGLYGLKYVIHLTSPVVLPIIGGVAFVPTYGGLLWVLREIRPEEVLIARRAITKLRRRIK